MRWVQGTLKNSKQQNLKKPLGETDMALYSEQTPGGTSHQITSLQLFNNVLYGAAGIFQFFEAILHRLMLLPFYWELLQPRTTLMLSQTCRNR